MKNINQNSVGKKNNNIPKINPQKATINTNSSIDIQK